MNVLLRNSKMSNVSKTFPLCKNYDETIEHASFHCKHARVTWFSSPFGVTRHSVLDDGLLDWVKNIISPSQSSTFIPVEFKA